MKSKLWLSILFITIFQFAAYSQDSLQGRELYNSEFTIDEVQRTFMFYVPLNYGKKETYPLVIFLHDIGNTGKNIIKSYGDLVHAKADSSDCIVVYPDAVANHWNDKMNDPVPATDTINDVGFLSILIDYFIQRYQCDAQQVYVAGFSNGGQMAYRLSCDIPAKLTAIASFLAMQDSIIKKCNPSTLVAVMDTKNFPMRPGEKITNDGIIQAWNFFMQHNKE